MKKSFVFGIMLLALAAALFFFPDSQQLRADSQLRAFKGAFESGRTVGAQQGIFWKAGVDNGNNTYYIDIAPWMTGWWTVTDGCQHFDGYWDGENTQWINFCVPQNCDCN